MYNHKGRAEDWQAGGEQRNMYINLEIIKGETKGKIKWSGWKVKKRRKGSFCD